MTAIPNGIARAGWVRPVVAIVVLVIALAAASQLLRSVSIDAVVAAAFAIPWPKIAAAVVLTIGSYLALTLYDWLALQVIGRSLPWRSAALASFSSYTLSHSLGFSLLTGGSARFRAYSAAGLGVGDVARVTAVTAAAFWSGVVALTGVALLGCGATLPEPFSAWSRLCGAAMLATVAVPAVLRAGGVRRVGWGRFTMPLPGIAPMGAQLAVAAADLLCASGSLYVLVPSQHLGVGAFFAAYALAIVATSVTQVPGGVGVFEATVLAAFSDTSPAIAAALLLYRVIYYLVPLAGAVALTLYLERRRLAAPARVGKAALAEIARVAAPTVAALTVFAAGLVLLLSGALPPVTERLRSLRDILPLPVVEVSHVAASIVGILLVMIAPALRSRLRSGLLAARTLLIVGAVLSLLKGFDFEEATLMLLAACLLHAGRRAFHRRGGVSGAPAGDWWWAAVLGALGLSTWIGFLAYSHTPYSNGLWLAVEWHGAAPRFLRAALAASLCAIACSVWRLTTAPAADADGTGLSPVVTRLAFAAACRADTMLAFTGDKRFLVSAAGDAFLMYRRHGRSWIVMGDPVGPTAAWTELAWTARRLCDRIHARLCFYQASAAMLPIIVELGMRPIKYGEEAIIDLSHGFPLDGGARRSLRHSVRRAVAAGLSFAIVPAAGVPAILEELRQVSDAWLAHKKRVEKRFSLGGFDAAYLGRFDCAVLRHDGRVVAFANIWTAATSGELSVDLMRHLPEAPYGAMDFLFVSLMQWGAAHGLSRFNLGLAPLSGLADGPLAPFWSRAGAALFEHGERFYGFSGLRAFKQKFGPGWEPRFIATPDGPAGWRTLIDVAALVGG